MREASIAFQPAEFDVERDSVAVGGQLVTIRGRAATYPDLFLPLYGAHQAQNAAVAVAAVEAFLGGGEEPLRGPLLEEAFATVTSPGRLQLVGTDPTIVVDAAHNPHGARSLARALDEVFDFDEWGLVFGALGDKDVAGIVAELAPAVARVFVTPLPSERAADVQELAALARAVGRETSVHADLFDATTAAREWAAESERRAVVVAGSVVLAGEAIGLAEDERWKP